MRVVLRQQRQNVEPKLVAPIIALRVAAVDSERNTAVLYIGFKLCLVNTQQRADKFHVFLGSFDRNPR
ncbi:hypothetical protein D3C84_1051810 [compost metagenome]